MAKKGVPARGAEPEVLPPVTLARRVGWMVLAGAWLFAAVALMSFDSADWPSHVVAAHNDPVANLCGSVGAFMSYWTYHVVGVGAWVFLAAIAAYLAITVTGRTVGHPGVRSLGLIIMVIAVSAAHALLLPNVGPLAGAKAGVVANYLIGELSPRFSTVGTLLILLATFGIGAIVAVDRLVLAIPRAILATFSAARSARLPRLPSLRDMARRPEEELPGPRRSRRHQVDPAGPIDPDAGGVGATEAFDPEEYEVIEVDEVDDDEYADDEEDADDADDADDEVEEAKPKRSRLTREQLREKIAKLPVRLAGAKLTVARDEDIPREQSFEGYQFPTLDLLVDPETNYSTKMEAFVRKQAEQLEEALETFGIEGEVVGIDSGPAVTQYSVQLAPGTKVAKITAVSSDVARAMRSENIRIVANMAGRTTVGIEVPNLHRERVRLKELMSSGEAEGMMLPMFLGKDASGEPLVADLTRMPHMLIAGTTGSGKSVCINSIIMSWLYTKRPDELKLVLVDPKMVELSQFADIPHLMCPVVTEMPRAAAILEWAVNKMEERYELLREAAVRDVTAYNQLEEEDLLERFGAETEIEKARVPKKLPYMVFVIDELADLMMTAKEVEHSIVRIAQKARAVGIHLMLATQRPQANVVTGLIKSNMPCRVSFKVASGMDSRIVLDQKGAEVLLGQGDMLFLTPHTSNVSRAQGTLVEESETRKVVKFLKNVAQPSFERSLIRIRPVGVVSEDGEEPAERDPMFDESVRVMIETGRGSVSLLQRRLGIGYSRASRLVDQMGLAGILGEHKGSVAREVLITLEEWEEMQALAEEEAHEDGAAEEDEEAAEVEAAEDEYEDEEEEGEDEGEEEYEDEDEDEEDPEDEDEDGDDEEEEEEDVADIETISEDAERVRG